MTAVVSVAVLSHLVMCLTPMSPQSCLFGRPMAPQMQAGLEGDSHHAGQHLQWHSSQHGAQVPWPAVPAPYVGIRVTLLAWAQQSRCLTSSCHHGCKMQAAKLMSVLLSLAVNHPPGVQSHLGKAALNTGRGMRRGLLLAWGACRAIPP